MKCYGVFMPNFKIGSALINHPVEGQSYIPKGSGWKDAPCGQKRICILANSKMC